MTFPQECSVSTGNDTLTSLTLNQEPWSSIGKLWWLILAPNLQWSWAKPHLTSEYNLLISNRGWKLIMPHYFCSNYKQFLWKCTNDSLSSLISDTEKSNQSSLRWLLGPTSWIPGMIIQHVSLYCCTLWAPFVQNHQLKAKCKQLDKGLRNKLPSRRCLRSDGGHVLSALLLCMVS